MWEERQLNSTAKDKGVTGNDDKSTENMVFRAIPRYWSKFPAKSTTVLNTALKWFGREVDTILKTKQPKANVSRKELQAIRGLKSDKSIFIVPADKGNATVVLNRMDYIKKMNNILSDDLHFAKLGTKNPTEARAKKLKKFLFTLKANKTLDDTFCTFLSPSDPRTPQMYGLVKVHKPNKNYPCRPIVSAVNAFNYNLGKFLVWIITPYLTSHKSYIKDAADFASKVSRIEPKGQKRVSFDVESLYTMVPVDEAIECALHKITSDTDPKHIYDMPSGTWKTLFEFCTKFCNFQFMGENYDQIEGLSMGNPLAPPLANLFMVKIEERALAIGLFTIEEWWRYVDDVFCILPKEESDDIDRIVVDLNSVHPSIRFTYEKESIEGNLAFLQVQSTLNSEGRYDTSIFRKETHTNLYVRWDSAHPESQKIGIFTTLVHQAMKLCSTDDACKQELDHLVATFLELGYPQKLLNNALKCVKDKRNNDSHKPKRERGKLVVMSLPYIPGISDRISNVWKRCARTLQLDYPTSVNFRPIRKLRSSLCQLYETEPEFQGVYKAICGVCQADYIGETSKLLTSRSKEHKYKGAVFDHVAETGHPFDRFSWTMIKRERNANKRKILEALLIREQNPSLNGNKGKEFYTLTDS